MTKKRSLLPFLIALACAWAAPLHAAERWYPVGEAANDVALKEHKLVLQVYKASNWARDWSDLVATDSYAKLDREVFARPEFQKFAHQHLILQLLDTSKDAPGDDTTRQMLHQSLRYWEPSIAGFPALLLHDGNWVEVGRRIGYRTGEADAVMAWLRAGVKKAAP